jgi:hypothetical protein
MLRGTEQQMACEKQFWRRNGQQYREPRYLDQGTLIRIVQEPHVIEQTVLVRVLSGRWKGLVGYTDLPGLPAEVFKQALQEGYNRTDDIRDKEDIAERLEQLFGFVIPRMRLHKD